MDFELLPGSVIVSNNTKVLYTDIVAGMSADHDVETANALGADCALVCRGHQSREHLLSTGAKVYNSLEELLSMIEGL